MPSRCPNIFQQCNEAQAVIRSWVELVFDQKKGAMALVIRTSAIERAVSKMALANLTYNHEASHLPRATTGYNLKILAQVEQDGLDLSHKSATIYTGRTKG